MEIFEARNISKSFGDRTLLKDISFKIKTGEKIGLVGWNGTGKTTLAKILLGQLEADSGTLSKFPPSLKIGYLPQMAGAGDVTGKNFAENGEILHTASELGLSRLQSWNEERKKGMSGGERLKLALAEIWAARPEFAILDEPTNHLDERGTDWLADTLAAFKGAALIISHDRYFLDRTANKIFELEDGKLSIYEGNYTAFYKKKAFHVRQQKQAYEKQQKDIKRVQQQITALKQWSDKAHREAGKGDNIKEFDGVRAKKIDKQIKSKQKRLESELSKHKVDKPKEDADIRFDFKTRQKRGQRILEVKDLTKTYGDRVLFRNSRFYVNDGEHIALSGPNGCGKTTLIRMLLGEEPVTSGEIWKSGSLRIAYLSQDMQGLPLEKTALQYIGTADRDDISKARMTLANLDLGPEKISKPLAFLSMGERIKVKLAKMVLEAYDVLILDEPTNHLDLPSREQMEDTLSMFQGTLLVVSHDRYFIEKLCNKMLLFDDGRIQRVEAGKREGRGKAAQQERNEELAVLETKIAEYIGKISLCAPGSTEYQEMDKELQKLMEQKRRLRQ